MEDDMKRADGTREGASVAVIGFGVAGFNACVALRGAGFEGPIEVFSDLEGLPYSPILTSYYAGGMKEFEECFPWSEDEVEALGLIIREDAVTDLDVGAHVVRTRSGAFPYAKCVIATGASPSTAGFPDGCAYAPLVLHSMADAERLKAAVSDAACERVLVSGASMVALKTLEACLAQGKRTTLVGMNPHVLDFNALPAAAERFERGLRAKGVELRLGQTIQAVEVEERAGHPRGRVLRVTFSNGEAAEFDEIAVAHGMRGNLGFVRPGSLKVEAGLLVDEFMRTSDADVYAAGDVAQALELTSGERKVVGIWKNAAVQGSCAGCAIAAEMAGEAPGPQDAYPGSISSNTIAVDGTLFISAGTMDPGAGARVEVREGDDMTVVYVYREEADGADARLVGFNITSDADEEGSVAYDTGAMLTLRILEGLGVR